MITLPKIHQFANTEDANNSVMLTMPDDSRLVIFSLDDAEQNLLRVFYAGDYASYFIGTRKEIEEVVEEDLHLIKGIILEDHAVSLVTLKSWGLKTLVGRFSKKKK